jgi:hypothetical protein
MTGLVLWPDQAADLDATYRDAISMEFVYCLPCRVVTGKEGERFNMIGRIWRIS